MTVAQSSSHWNANARAGTGTFIIQGVTGGTDQTSGECSLC